MKRKPLLILGLGTLAILGAAAWLFPGPPLAIRFVEFRDHRFGRGKGPGTDRLAVFRLDNKSGSPFTFQGFDASSPVFSYRFPAAAGWQRMELGWQGAAAGFYTIAPHGSIEFSAEILPGHEQAPFQVGVFLQRGTAEEVIKKKKTSLERWFWNIRFFFGPGDEEPEMTWSDLTVPRPAVEVKSPGPRRGGP